VIKSIRLANVVVILIVSLGVWHLGCAAWIYSKAYAARFLINDAWQSTLETNEINKPWSWADTWPVAEITIPAIGLDEVVLAGDSGATLAFGPGLSDAGAAFDSSGVKLISAHRDTHFSKLQDIQIRDDITIQTPAGSKQYTVTHMEVVDASTYSINSQSGSYDLVLATCYPFDSVNVGESERFIVWADEI